MAQEIFNIDFRKGSFIEKYSGVAGTNVGNKITKQEKGMAYTALQSNLGQITYPAVNTTALNFGTGAFSMVCAFRMGKFVNIGSSYNFIYGKGANSGVNLGLGLYYQSGQELIFIWGDGAGTVSSLVLDDFGSLYDNKYHLAILTFDGTTYKGFLDNVQETTTSTTTRTITTTAKFDIGSEGTTTRRSNSSVAYIRAYDNCLTQAERNALYEEYLHSHSISEQKRGFSNPKVSDLSNEIDSKVGDEIIQPLDFTTWTPKSDTVVNNATTFTTSASGKGITKSYSGVIVAGKRYRVYISGTTTSVGGFTFRDTYPNIYHTISSAGSFTEVFDITAIGSSFYIRNQNSGITVMSNFTVTELTGLVASYNMIPSAGGVLVDTSGNGNDGTINGPLSMKDGLAFDGVDDYVDCGNLGFSGDLSYSVCLKIKPKTVSGTHTILDTENWWGQAIYQQDDGIVFIRYALGSKLTTASNVLKVGKETNIVVIYDSNVGMSIYVNGVLINSNTETGSSPFYFKYIGKRFDENDFFNGEIQDLKLYNYAFTPQQAKDYHNSFNQVTLRDTFSDAGVGDTKTFGWDNVSGSGEVIEETTGNSIVKLGDKSWQQNVAGIRATQSKQAYGEWEFDLRKGGDATETHVIFINSNTDGYSVTSDQYSIRINSAENFYLKKRTGSILATAPSYININTDYRIKVARLASAGVFKDIPTLQVSDMVNSTYTTFTSHGRYGFSAAITGGSGGAGTADEINIINGGKYLVEFDLKLNSGAPPGIRFRETLSSTTRSNSVTAIEGRNSCTLTTTATSTVVLNFYSSTTDYEISGLTIRRIYDADTFAVFIKGGSFGNEYTLVDVAGGSGTNPVTDSTYKTSEYFVSDLDAGDTLTNLITRSQVLQ